VANADSITFGRTLRQSIPSGTSIPVCSTSSLCGSQPVPRMS
jgi:hypothetical protein